MTIKDCEGKKSLTSRTPIFINLKTARSLGITVPLCFVATDEAIE